MKIYLCKMTILQQNGKKYHKKLKIRTPEKFAVIILKIEQFGFMTE